MKSLLKSLLVSATLVAGLVATAGVANAKQCIWNKSWFLLKTEWYEVGPFMRHLKGQGAKPRAMQTDVWPTMQGRCTRGRNANRKLVAVLSVQGGEILKPFTEGVLKSVASIGAAAACVGSFGTACIVGAGSMPAVMTAIDAMPNGKTTFSVIMPDNKRYVDVWGSAWDPQTKSVGGPIPR